jgi:hypothetical protein
MTAANECKSKASNKVNQVYKSIPVLYIDISTVPVLNVKCDLLKSKHIPVGRSVGITFEYLSSHQALSRLN